MLYCDRIDASKGIDVNKTKESKECDVLKKGCNECHNLLMML